MYYLYLSQDTDALFMVSQPIPGRIPLKSSPMVLEIVEKAYALHKKYRWAIDIDEPMEFLELGEDL